MSLKTYVEQNQERAMKIALHITKNEADAEDLVQATYAQLAAAKKDPVPKNPASYLYGVMQRRFYTRNSRSKEFLSETGTLPDLQFTDNSKQENRMYLQDLIKQRKAPIYKKGRARDRILDLLIQDYTFAEIAEKTNTDYDTIKSQVYKLISELRKIAKVTVSNRSGRFRSQRNII